MPKRRATSPRETPKPQSNAGGDTHAPGSRAEDRGLPAAGRLTTDARQVSLGDLETILGVSRAGSPGRAADQLGRQHSSVLKQFNSLNETFDKICGEQLAAKQERGEDYLLTSTGEHVAELAARILEQWSEGIETQRRIVGHRLTIATTTFTLRILETVWSQVATQIPTAAVDLQVRQIRTKDFHSALQSRKVDLVIGGRAVEAGTVPQSDDFEFLEWGRTRPVLRTNLSKDIFPYDSITKDTLRKYPIVLPHEGIIVDLMRKWYGPSYSDQLRLTPPVEDIYYGVSLLALGIERAFFVVLEGAWEAAEIALGIQRSSSPTTAPTVRSIALGNDFEQLEVVTGLFGRRGDRVRYESSDPQHPLALFWRVFEAKRPRGSSHP